MCAWVISHLSCACSHRMQEQLNGLEQNTTHKCIQNTTNNIMSIWPAAEENFLLKHTISLVQFASTNISLWKILLQLNEILRGCTVYGRCANTKCWLQKIPALYIQVCWGYRIVPKGAIITHTPKKKTLHDALRTVANPSPQSVYL